jgi:hypothetical protein
MARPLRPLTVTVHSVPPYRAAAAVFDYAQLVRFETAQGAVVTVAGMVRSSLFRYKVGEKRDDMLRRAKQVGVSV